jgi:hypothetical protein
MQACTKTTRDQREEEIYLYKNNSASNSKANKNAEQYTHKEKYPNHSLASVLRETTSPAIPSSIQ